MTLIAAILHHEQISVEILQETRMLS